MKHFRRRACAAFKEFSIRKEDEDMIANNVEEDTTLATRSNNSPTEAIHLQELMEMIDSDFVSKSLIKQQNKLKLRQEVLNQFASLITKPKKLQIVTQPKNKQPKKILKQQKPNSKSKSLKDSEILLPGPSLRSYRRVKGSLQV